MSTDTSQKPHERLAIALAEDMAAVSALIRERMASEYAPASPKSQRIWLRQAASVCARC